jgi:carbon monoxide dehydrogenase subunit G
MKLSSQFTVPAAPDKVVALFFDPATMRECLPGCEELQQVDEKTFRGVLTNEVAHVKFKAGFSADITSVEQPADDTSPAVVKAVLKGEDRRLGSTIKIDATMTITPVGQESRVDYDLEMAMWGKLGRLGEAVIRRRSVEVERQFSEALAAVVTGQPIPHRQKAEEKAAKKAAGRTAIPAAPAVGQGTDQVTGQPTVAPILDPVADRKQDLPFIVAVAAAAFAWGIIFGGRKRSR